MSQLRKANYLHRQFIASLRRGADHTVFGHNDPPRMVETATVYQDEVLDVFLRIYREYEPFRSSLADVFTEVPFVFVQDRWDEAKQRAAQVASPVA